MARARVSGVGEPDAAESAGDSLARASRAEFACSSMMRTAARAVKEAESEWRSRLPTDDGCTRVFARRLLSRKALHETGEAAGQLLERQRIS